MTGKNGGFALSQWSLRTPTLVILLTVAAIVVGLLNYFTMSRREDPEIRIATALVITVYPGAGADQVEEQVTRKMEDEIESMDNLKTVASISRANISVIFVTVDYAADTDMEWQKLRARVTKAKGEMPPSIIGPDIIDNFGDTTGMLISLTGAGPVQMEEVAKELKSALRRIPSVGDIEIYGEQPEVVYLEARRADMANYGFTPYQVGQMLELRNLRVPGGAIRTERYEFRLAPTGAYKSLEDIKNTIIDVSETTGQPVHIRDLFSVTREPRNPPNTELYQNGEQAVLVGIVMKDGYNIVQMGSQVREVLEKFSPRLPQNMKMEVVHDSPRQVDDQVNAFMKNLIEGMVIVIIAMALLMGLRSAAISAVAIPISVLIALAFMPALKIDLEMVSISAFIVALGMLVDNSIIVTDNVDVKLRHGMAPDEAAWKGAHELIKPVVVGTLATVVAFVPMLLLSDETGAYVRSLPLVVTVSLLGSLVVSQTITPLMARKMMRPPKKKKTPIDKTRTARGYGRFMSWCLRWRFVVVLLTLACLVGAVIMFRAVGFSFFPDAFRDQFTVDIWLKEGSSITETSRIARLAEQELLKDPMVDSTVVHVGQGGPRFYITIMPEFQTSNYAQIMVNTKDPNATFDVIDRFNERARNKYPGARVFAKKIVMGKPIQAPVEFRIVGDDLKKLKAISAQIQQILREIPGTTQVKDNTGPDVPSLKVDINTELANRVGVTNTDVALAFLSSYEGYELTRFNDGDDEIPIVLRLKDDERHIDADINNLPIASTITSEKVPLGGIADVKPQWGPGLIRRYQNQRTVTVQAWTNGRLANDVVLDAWPIVSSLKLPDGYTVEIAGEKEEMDKAFLDLTIVFGIILISLLALLVYQLGTLRRTAVVLLSVPLSTIGASLGLFLGGYSFSFMAFLGVVSLAGMAIKNSVVWIEFVEDARLQGASIKEAVVKAGIYRLRPIVLTAATTVGGLFPLALFGGVLFESMAWAMIVGLSLVTVFTLISIPIFYSLLMKESS